MAKKTRTRQIKKARRSERVNKDVIERILTSDLASVATILNFVLYDGKPMIKAGDLQILRGEHAYFDSKNQLREQRRDSFFLWKEGEVVFSFVGLESQSAIDADMPLRCFSYDGLGYREQTDNPDGKRYPVITFVIYYGEEPWTKGLTLRERLCFSPKIASVIEPFFNDYKVNVIDVRRLTKEDIQKLRGVFAFVAASFYCVDHPQDVIQKPKIKQNKDKALVRLFLGAFFNEEDVGRLHLDELLDGDSTMTEFMNTVIQRKCDAALQKGVAIGQEKKIQAYEIKIKESERKIRESERERRESERERNAERKARERERQEYEKSRKTTAFALIQDGSLSKAKIAKCLRIDQATLDAWLAEM